MQDGSIGEAPQQDDRLSIFISSNESDGLLSTTSLRSLGLNCRLYPLGRF